MRAEALRPRCKVLWVVAAVLTTGCATLPVPSGAGGSHGSTALLRDESAVVAYTAQPHSSATTREKRPRRRHSAPGVGTDAAVVLPALSHQGPATCGGRAVPEGWPDYSSWWDEELLAPFFGCTSPAEFLTLQRKVNMPRLVEALDDWNAVRLGALGPLEDKAARVLQRKRLSFLLAAQRDYGAYAQIFTLFLLDTAFDDEVRELLGLLAKDKQLAQTLGQMHAVAQALARRGFLLSDFQDRDEHLRDVLRGLGRAADDVRSTLPMVDGLRGGSVFDKRAHLPPLYQQAFDETFQALLREHFAPGHVALGTFDAMTFGVPLGFYSLAAGTGHGVSSLTQGQYEQATRELAPAGLLVGLYAGGRSLRSLSQPKEVPVVGESGAGHLALELRLQSLKGVVERLRHHLGEEGLGQVADYLQARREAAVLVGAGGERAALALHEARGNVAQAQAWLSQARREPTGPSQLHVSKRPASTSPPKAEPARAPGGMASLVDEAAGLTQEVLQSRLLRAELESTGPRLSTDVGSLKQLHPSREAPPPGVPKGSALWEEYVSYRERRLTQLEKGQKVEGPLRWEGYERMRGLFARGLAFERIMATLLRADAALPRAQRVWLQDFNEPRIETYVGVAKEGQPGVRYADMLVIEQRPPAGQPPRVESLSFKSRDLRLLDEEVLEAQMKADATAALKYYGETLNIRRPSLKYLGPKVQVRRVRLVYEGGAFMPESLDMLKNVVPIVQEQIRGVEVLVQ